MKKRVLSSKNLIIKEDYRKIFKRIRMKGFYYPLNEATNFKVNKYFRQITKNITVKERNDLNH